MTECLELFNQHFQRLGVWDYASTKSFQDVRILYGRGYEKLGDVAIEVARDGGSTRCGAGAETGARCGIATTRLPDLAALALPLVGERHPGWRKQMAAVLWRAGGVSDGVIRGLNGRRLRIPGESIEENAMQS